MRESDTETRIQFGRRLCLTSQQSIATRCAACILALLASLASHARNALAVWRWWALDAHRTQIFKLGVGFLEVFSVAWNGQTISSSNT